MSFSIHNREFVIVIGPSGCGKSTLLKILGGLTEPSSGNLLVEQGSESEFRVATVFQDAALFPWMRAFDNASFGLRLNGQSKGERRARARKELARVGLEGFEQAYPSELSGGMRQRVNLARALCIDPHLMLMDEPFAALDVQTKMVMQEQLLEIWERDRRTVVFVTHSIMEALVLGDRILVMGTNPGRLIAEIDVPFDRPRTPNEIRYDPEFLRLERELENMIRLQYRDGTHVEGFGAANA
ncbi:MAG: ABC transporter ATP-binding protein [Acidimicrobiia bacterium]